MKTSKSHGLEDIRRAIARGEEIWEFDSGNDGEDDVLIGTLAEIQADLIAFFGSLHNDWTFRQISPEEVAAAETWYELRINPTSSGYDFERIRATSAVEAVKETRYAVTLKDRIAVYEANRYVGTYRYSHRKHVVREDIRDFSV